MTDPLTVVQDLYGAFASGDMDAAMAILSEGLVFELGGTSRFSGRHEGRERVLALQGELMSVTGMTNEVCGMYAGDDLSSSTNAAVHVTRTKTRHYCSSLLRMAASRPSVSSFSTRQHSTTS